MTGLVTLGETLGLVTAAPGPLAQAATASLGVGGAESNVAIGVRRLGGEATWVGRLGADSFGARVRRELLAEGLHVLAVTDPHAPTALMVKERRTAEAGRVWYYRAGSAGSRLAPQDVPAELVRGADVLHLTGITAGLSASALATVRHALAAAVEAGVPVSFDVNHRAAVWSAADPGPVYAELAAASAVVFAGPEEARLLTGAPVEDPHRLLDLVAEQTGGDVVLKLGADGCLARVDDELIEVAAVPVPVVDTVGAGDAFVAGYLADLMLGRPARERLATAARAGAVACTSSGDWEGLPTRVELATLLSDGERILR